MHSSRVHCFILCAREETIDKDAKAVVIMILFIFAFFDYSANIGILFPA